MRMNQIPSAFINALLDASSYRQGPLQRQPLRVLRLFHPCLLLPLSASAVGDLETGMCVDGDQDP